MSKFATGVLCLFLFAVSCWAEDVSTILARMNAAAPSFHALSADVQMITYTAVIQDKIVEDGTLKMQKGKGGDVRAVLDFSGLKNSAREIGFYGKIIRMYYPNAKDYQDFEVGKNGALVNQFLLLGFGSSGDELSASYTISSEGTEKVAGLNTTKLLLIPKDPKVKERLAKVEIWIPEGQANPIEQKFYEETSGNYYQVTYSNINLKPSFKGPLEIKMLPGTQKRS